jgi:hypothetical protein
VKHLTVYYKNSPDTYGFIETFDPPTVFPLDGTTGDSLTSTGYTTIHIPGVEDPFLLTQFYTLDVLDTDASIDLAFGTVTGCLKIRATVNDDLEQPPLVVDVYIHPTLNVVYFEGAPGVALAEMVSPWE